MVGLSHRDQDGPVPPFQGTGQAGSSEWAVGGDGPGLAEEAKQAETQLRQAGHSPGCRLLAATKTEAVSNPAPAAPHPCAAWFPWGTHSRC